MKNVLIFLALMFVLLCAGCGSSSTSNGGTSSVTVTLSPSNGATAQATNVAVTATFSAAITEPSSWATAFTLKLDNAGSTLCASVTYNSTTKVATCAHADLNTSSSYTISVSGITNVTDASATFGTGATASFSLTSDDITSGGAVGQTYADTLCSGSNQSPELSWVNPPDGTLSYAITLIDQDAASFIHWIMYNIPESVTSLDRAASTPSGATVVVNSNGAAAYGGPCPDVGVTHTYRFTVYALDVANTSSISGFDASGNSAFTTSININTLGTAWFDATYTGQ